LPFNLALSYRIPTLLMKKLLLLKVSFSHKNTQSLQIC
jgi:hypothetical protein